MQESPCHVRQIQDRLHKLLPSFATTAFTTMSRVNLEPQRPNVLMTNTCCGLWKVMQLLFKGTRNMTFDSENWSGSCELHNIHKNIKICGIQRLYSLVYVYVPKFWTNCKLECQGWKRNVVFKGLVLYCNESWRVEVGCHLHDRSCQGGHFEQSNPIPKTLRCVGGRT